MAGQSEFTLPEVARVLGETQHRLIHLCEKGAVVPDIEDARGRGTSRRFSRRNVLEFAVALELRRMMLPVAVAAAVIHVLRVFDRHVRREIRSFSLPDGLRVPDAPDLRVILSDGRFLYFALGLSRSVPKVFGGIDMHTIITGGTDQGSPAIRQVTASRGPSYRQRYRSDDFGTLEGSKHTRVEISITRIARDLALD